MNHEFVNLLKIGRRVGQKRIGDIEGLFDNRVTSDDDNCIFLQGFFRPCLMKMILWTCVGCLSVMIVGVQIQMMISENPSELLRWQCFLKTDHNTILNEKGTARQSKLNVFFCWKRWNHGRWCLGTTLHFTSEREGFTSRTQTARTGPKSTTNSSRLFRCFWLKPCWFGELCFNFSQLKSSLEMCSSLELKWVKSQMMEI